MSFEQAIEAVLASEGGYSDDPLDRGGPTQWGITQATYDQWRTRQGLPVQPVTGIGQDEAQAIYRTDYWERCGCDDLPAGIALLVFDTAVNSGPLRALMMLQASVGVTQDGSLGPATRAALHAFDAAELVRRYTDQRLDWYARICQATPPQTRFLRGWISRARKMERMALQ